MEELIEMYRQSTLMQGFRVDKMILERNHISEHQWINFIDLIEDLELNEEGVRILLDEITVGHLVLD